MIHERCTVCHRDTGESETEQCGRCGLTVHTRCAAFVQHYECPVCAEELAIGAVEF